MTATIEIDKVTVKFGKNTVVDIPRLRMAEPGLTVLSGPNGAGKSTLLRLCAGLSRPDEGTILVGGVAAHRRQARRACGYSPDHPVLFDDLSIRDNIAYAYESSGEDEVAPLGRDLIEAFSFQPLLERFPGQMSRGQRQAASLLVAASRTVDVLLFDEPTLALDADKRVAFADALIAHGRDQLFVVASHEEAITSRAARRIRMEDGKVDGSSKR